MASKANTGSTHLTDMPQGCSPTAAMTMTMIMIMKVICIA